MGFETIVPPNIFGGWVFRFSLRGLRIGLLYHSLQCDQRWIFILGTRQRRLAYRTLGDAKPHYAIVKDAGWWWPWQTSRTYSGRG